MLVDSSILFCAELKNRECGYMRFGMVWTLYTGALHDSLIFLLYNEGGATSRCK